MTWATVASAAVGLIAANQSRKAAKAASQTPSLSTSEPWSAAQPYLQRGFQEAQGILNQGYPADTQALLRARGLYGSPVTQEARNLAGSTLRGDYLNSNPFTQNAAQDAMGMARSQINSQFGGSGGNNFGSSAHQEWLGRGLVNAAMPYFNQNYENERGRQFAAMSQAPSLAGLDYQDINAVQQADFLPWDFLGRYQNIVGGLNQGGGTTATTQPYFSNSANSFLGGALLGNQLYKSFQQPAQSNAYGSPNDMSNSWLGLGG